MIETSKYCPRCKSHKTTSDFSKSKSNKDGLYTYCRVCHAEWYQENKKVILSKQKVHYEKNKTAILEKQVEYRKKQDKEAIRIYNTNYRKNNLEKIKAKKRLYYEKNTRAITEKNMEYNRKHKETILAYGREYHKENRERLLIRHKEYWQETKSLRNQKQKEYQKTHPESRKASKHNRKARLLKSEGSFKSSEWRELKESHNNTCLCCGKREPEIKIVPDHIVALAKGGRNDIKNIQPLCQTCNLKKGVQTIDYRTDNQKPSQ